MLRYFYWREPKEVKEMKQILSWNEECLDLRVVTVIPDDDAERVFRNYVTERTMKLLGVTLEEAHKLMEEEDWETDAVHYNDGNASIDYGDYCEFMSLEDVQVLSEELLLPTAAAPLLEYVDSLLEVAPDEFDDNVSDEENDVYADLQNLKESLERYLHKDADL